MPNYIIELDKLAFHVEEAFPRLTQPLVSSHDENFIKELRKSNSRYWGARDALLRCTSEPLRDPCDILDEVENEYNIISLFDMKQEINKEHYMEAANAVKDMKEFLYALRE